MSFTKALAAALVSLTASMFVIWASGIKEAWGISYLEIAGLIPWWLYAAGLLVVAGGVFIDRGME